MQACENNLYIEYGQFMLLFKETRQPHCHNIA